MSAEVRFFDRAHQTAEFADGSPHRGCDTCDHRRGRNPDFWRCGRTGEFVEFESVCHPATRPYWAPRRGVLARLRDWLVGVRP